MASTGYAIMSISHGKGGVFITVTIRNQVEFLKFLAYMCSEFSSNTTPLELFLDIKSNLSIHFPYGEIAYATIFYRADTVDISLTFKDSRFSLVPPALYAIKYHFNI